MFSDMPSLINQHSLSRQNKGLIEMFETQKPDVIVNFAAESHVDRSIDNPGIFLASLSAISALINVK